MQPMVVGNLRDYQREMLSRLQEAWRMHRSVMVQMPTGTGKTHVLASLVNEELKLNELSSCHAVFYDLCK